MPPLKGKFAVSMEIENDKEGLPKPNISSIKNKQRRQDMYKKMKVEKRKIKLKEKKKKKDDAKKSGREVLKQIPKTIESMRVPDETMVDMNDEEVLKDSAIDEFSNYFNRETTPKVLITTADRPRMRCFLFCQRLKEVIPNSFYYYRKGLDLKKILTQMESKGFTDLVVVNADRKIPNGLLICHLPNGPTVQFRMSNVILPKEIKRVGKTTEHLPEVILNNFNTRLGHTVGRMLAALFPHDPQFQGRRVVTFHNQRDYIFFRHHRYQFRNEKRVGLHELGPRFTLKLRSLQKGIFDSKFGEFEWVHKRRDMDTSRRKFHL